MTDGVDTLHHQRVLNDQVNTHSPETLPAERNKLKSPSMSVEQETPKYKNLHPDDPIIKREVMMQLISQLDSARQKTLTGSGSQINIELSGGAENSILHEQSPFEIAKTESDEREICLVIQNVHVIRTSLFTSDKASEIIGTPNAETERTNPKRCGYGYVQAG